MQPITQIIGIAAPLLLANIDTDVIIRIERLIGGDRAMLGRHAFEALRYQPDGTERADFILNRPPYRDASILIAGPNFGCGSSREGAVWALLSAGIRCVIADSFGDIFFSNCFQNGLLPIRSPDALVVKLAHHASQGAQFTVDLVAQKIEVPGESYSFDIDPRRRESLIEGLDDIGLSLKELHVIRSWQEQDHALRPWVWTLNASEIDS